MSDERELNKSYVSEANYLAGRLKRAADKIETSPEEALEVIGWLEIAFLNFRENVILPRWM